MANVFDQFDAPGVASPNVFDQFDSPAPAAANVFDQFDAPASIPNAVSAPDGGFWSATAPAANAPNLSGLLEKANPNALLDMAPDNRQLPHLTAKEFAQETARDAQTSVISGLLPRPEGDAYAGVRKAEDVIEGLASPFNMALAAVLPGAPAIAQKAIGAYFAGTMGKEAIQKVPEVAAALKSGDYTKAGEDLTEAGLSGLFATGAGAHVFGRPGTGGFADTTMREPGMPQEQIDRISTQLAKGFADLPPDQQRQRIEAIGALEDFNRKYGPPPLPATEQAMPAGASPLENKGTAALTQTAAALSPELPKVEVATPATDAALAEAPQAKGTNTEPNLSTPAVESGTGAIRGEPPPVPDEASSSTSAKAPAAAESTLAGEPAQPGRKFKAPAPTDEHFDSDPLVQLVKDNGGLISKAEALRRFGKERFEEHAGEWDDAPTLASSSHLSIYNRQTGLMPNEMVTAAEQAHLLPERASISDLWNAIGKASKNAILRREQIAAQSAHERGYAQQSKAFDDAAGDTDKPAIAAGDLNVGDKVKVGTETMKVTHIDPDTFDVTLEDGKKFGVQEVKDGEVIYGEHEAGSEAKDQFPAREPALPKFPKGDLLSSQTEDLRLVGEKGVDTQRLADEKAAQEKAKEEAKAQQEREQTKLFEPAPEAPKVTRDEAYVKAYKLADQIADQAAKGEADSVREEAFKAALGKATADIEGDAQFRFNPKHMRDEANRAKFKELQRMGVSLEESGHDQTAGEGPSPDEEAATSEYAGKAVELLNGLSAREQELIRRVTMQGDDLQDVADDMGITKQAVQQAHARALAKLTGQMEAAGYKGGPGAMGLPEALQMGENIGETGIRNAVVDQERVKRGLPPRVTPLRQAFGTIWDAAMRSFDRNPEVGSDLVNSLEKKIRPLTDFEDAILTHEQLVRHEAFDEAVANVNKAENPAELAEAQAGLAIARERVHQIYDVGTRAGTENGRGLSARRLMVREDYSLAKMEARLRAENGGEPLNKEQLEAVKAAHERIAELEKKIAENESKQRDDLAKHYFDQLLQETKKDIKESVKSGRTVTDFFSQQADKARERIAARRKEGRLNALPVDELIDHAIIGADYIAKGITDFAKWSAAMAKDFGESVKPFLAEIFDASKKYHDANSEIFLKTASKSDKSPEAIVSRAKGKPLDHRTVYELARAHILAGVDGFDAVMKAVHADLKEAFPDLTEREARDAFSQYGEKTFPSKEADRVKLAEYRRVGQLVSAIEDAMKGERPQKTGMQRNKPTQAIREKMSELKAAMENAGLDSRTSEEELSGRLDAYKTRLKNGTEDVQKRIAKNDYAKRTRTPLEVDKEAFKLRADYEREKQKFDAEVAKRAAQNRTKSQKFWDRFVGVERALKLSSDVVLAKLTLAASIREGVLTPAEEGVGGLVSKVLPRLAERAPREGGLSLSAEVKAKSQMFTRGMKDAWDNLRMRKSDLEVTQGNRRPQAPPEWYEYFGFLHAALKAPVKRAEFARSLEKRMQAAARSGVDLDNPETMRRLAQESYVDANRAIFMQDNVLSKAFTVAMNMMEKSKTSPLLGPAAARLGRFLVPIVKVPTNIVGEVATGVHGTVSGGARAAHAYLKGIDSLPPEQADAIMRQLKKGIVGNAFLLAGYYGYKSIGGFYHDKDKRPASDVQPNRFRLGTVDLPSFVAHSTAAMLLNIGATLHRVQEERAKGGGKRGLATGALVAGSGLAKELPMIPSVTGIVNALGTEEGFQKYMHDLVTSSTTPALTQHIAKVIDTPGTFPRNAFQPATRRSPTNAVEAVKMGIPGMRQQVPTKPKR